MRIGQLDIASRANGRKTIHNACELKPSQRCDLEAEVDAECDLVCDCWIVAIMARPLLQDQSDCVLEHEGPAEMKNVQGTVGAASQFLGKYSATMA